MTDCTKESFLQDVQNHKCEILHDCGVYRHVMFSDGTFNRKFYLTTVPGSLLYTGDMGTFAFSRLHDMFQFFVSDYSDGRLDINPAYWHEKLIAVDKNGGSQEDDLDKFKQIMIEQMDNWIKEQQDEGEIETEGLLDALRVRSDILVEIDDIYSMAVDNGLSYGISMATEWEGRHGFKFNEIWDYRYKTYNYRFIWCLWAIVWGIRQYNEMTVQTN